MGEALIVRRWTPKELFLLYDSGNEFVSLTGGWVTGYSFGTGTQTKETNNILMTTNGGTRTYVTNNQIDLTDINKLYLDTELTRTSGTGNIGNAIQVGGSKTGEDNEAAVSTGANVGRRIIELDVSALTGLKYIKMRQASVTSNSSSGIFFKLWGEK